MLPNQNQGDLKAAFETTIYLLGTSATWKQTKPPTRSILMTIGAKNVGRDDVEVVNAVGINGRILTTRAIDFDNEIPAKFDIFTIGTNDWVANNVQEIWLNGVVLGWKIYARARTG